MNTATPTLYLRLRKKIRLPKGQPVRLGDVSQMLVDPEYEPVLQQLVLFRPEEQDGNLALIDMLLIASKVKREIPALAIENYGEPHMLVEFMEQSRPARLWLIIPVWFLLFIGSGLAIMNFHQDVGMLHAHRRIVYLLTGRNVGHPYWLQIPYSFGIGFGMAIFFNRLFRKKFNEEPNPLEVEMFTYQESVNRYAIADEYCKARQKGKPR